MIPDFPRHKQTETWNCFPTAVACVIGEDPADLPQVKVCHIHMWDRPRSRWGLWQRRTGYRFKLGYLGDDFPQDKLYVGLYRTVHGNGHAVVCYNGFVVHNPATKRVGLDGVPYLTVEVVKEEA